MATKTEGMNMKKTEKTLVGYWILGNDWAVVVCTYCIKTTDLIKNFYYKGDSDVIGLHCDRCEKELDA